MPKRIVTSQRLKKLHSGIAGESERGHYEPEILVKDYDENGYLDTEVSVGKRDLKKLGYPQRIKVVIYNID